jgi:hypothetical protein
VEFGSIDSNNNKWNLAELILKCEKLCFMAKVGSELKTSHDEPHGVWTVIDYYRNERIDLIL